ncbi:hypothetical protein DER45DRAFT_618694 [Fusarium avenaceum]|nr:hypothetical protein DER45DRAFT_618694 [Fusarium avenaceum]
MIPSSFKNSVFITHITTATALIEIDSVRLITDPIFDEVIPMEYDAAPLLPQASQKVPIELSKGPALNIKQLPFVQGVLLSHEDHFDNPDETGRQLLVGPRALQAWQTLTYSWEGEAWSITGVPCVHLPGGEVTGFVIHKETFGYQSDGRPNVIYFTDKT